MSTRGLQQRDGNTPQKRRKAKKSKGPARNGAKSRVKGKRRRPCLLAPCSASASVLAQPYYRTYIRPCWPPLRKTSAPYPAQRYKPANTSLPLFPSLVLQVVVRVRPTIDEDRNNLLSEEDGVECVAASAAGHDVVLSRPFYPPKEFEFDCVLGPKSSQESVYDAVARDIVRDTMQGFNATVMCYGQVRRRCGRATSDEWMHGSKRGLYGSAIACVLQCRGRRVRRTGTESCYRGRVYSRGRARHG